jgi:hypothetical protein
LRITPIVAVMIVGPPTVSVTSGTWPCGSTTIVDDISDIMRLPG